MHSTPTTSARIADLITRREALTERHARAVAALSSAAVGFARTSPPRENISPVEQGQDAPASGRLSTPLPLTRGEHRVQKVPAAASRAELRATPSEQRAADEALSARTLPADAAALGLAVKRQPMARATAEEAARRRAERERKEAEFLAECAARRARNSAMARAGVMWCASSRSAPSTPFDGLELAL